MLIYEFDYFIFLTVLTAILSKVKKNNVRKVIILISSLFFFASWDYRFCVLLALPIIVDFNIGKLLYLSTDYIKRKILIILSLTVNIGVLFSFKYMNFFIESFAIVIESAGLNPHGLKLILPIGISFYTFRSLTYTIDAYRYRNEVCKSLLDYAVYMAFFPIILAGPISRASNFLIQLKQHRPISKAGIYCGIHLIVIGLFKKVFVADNLSPFVNAFYASPELYSQSTAWLAVVSYSLQIYFDFSGYTDIARGSAKVLGYDIEINFNFPLLAQSIQDFWRRWHITLSNWIRDYLYIPLGGSRKGGTRTYFNLMVSMLLCGLWHGAGWNFVFWGGYHGIGLCANRWLGEHESFMNIKLFEMPVIKWMIAFLFVTIGWILFRAPDLSTAIKVLGMLVKSNPGVEWLYPKSIIFIVGTFLYHLLVIVKVHESISLPIEGSYTPTILMCMLWLVILFHSKNSEPFIYLQF